MSSVNDRVVVEFVRSLGSPSSSGDAGTSNPTEKASRKRLLARINADEAKLSAEGRPWYEVKASSLQESDKAIIKDLSGMSDQYEILIPLPEDRAHLPPEGYHTFYLNHLEMGLSVGDPDPPPVRQRKNKNYRHREAINTNNSSICIDIHRVFSQLPVWHLCLAPTADRIMKSYLLEAYKKQESEVSRGSNPPTEERGNPYPEEPSNPPPTELTKEKRRRSSSGRRSLDEVMAKHDNLMKEIEEVRGASDAEKKSLANKLAASEASVTHLQEEIKKVGEEAEEKIKKVQEEAEASWEKKKEGFLKSDEFDRLCSTRALSFFQQGFNGCLAQIRTNGYSEAEHPFSFLNVLKSLEDLPDEGEVESSMAKKYYVCCTVNFFTVCWCMSAEEEPGSDQFHEEIGTSTVGCVGLLIRSTTGIPIPSSVCTRKHDEDFTDGISSPERSEQVRR
ncbi:hypothetical protein F511_34751 [Dorcoceras hygrometricum]|uniref:Uncharacterized protein n=1 Tax=Dorcoceras hygrometricum TaxID=472368 RepID=A0A2Z7AMZ3_9LAMI|nr:hypothetical protein F511_34751 [Dorcoceras hygrometricum]